MTPEIELVLLVLAATVFLFITELLRADIIAILIMLTLSWAGLVKPAQAFSGLASNAVVSIIGVMILGYGVDRSGIMNRMTRPILSVAGTSEKRLVGLVSAVIGIISAFMQNIGGVALFLPAVLRISRNMRIPASRLLMPMGFAAILGGNLSMVGSSPLIILNDLLRQNGNEPFGLFSVTPVGLPLLLTGILYFLIFGKFVLKKGTKQKMTVTPQQELVETWHLPSKVYPCFISKESPLIGITLEQARLWPDYNLHIIAIKEGHEIVEAPGYHTRFALGQKLVMLGESDDVERFVKNYNLYFKKGALQAKDLQSMEGTGFAEIIIPPRSPIAGKTLREIKMRKKHNVIPLVLLSGDREEHSDFFDQPLQVGDAVIVHGRWEKIKALGVNHNFALVTPIEAEATGKARPVTAAACFLGAIALALSGTQLSLSFMSGALAMILLRVISIDNAYKAVDWRTVFLLAGLIPLGLAMDQTGAAAYIASHLMQVLRGSHILVILLSVAVLSTLFSLFMSNVAATVLLTPLVMIMGKESGTDPRTLALLVAICASNSFLLPTHQVNALLMAPGGYRNADYLKAGGIMTILFTGIAVGLIYLLYL